jgi:predicted GTPase
MSRWRVILVLILILMPFLCLAGVGSYTLWQSGLGFRLWWIMFACMSAGYLLGWYWLRKKQLLRLPVLEEPRSWTDRDREAFKKVETRAQQAVTLQTSQLTDLHFYVEQAQQVAQELASFYHPGVKDPVGALTIPEILAVIELASQDLYQLVDTYLPAGHLLTIDHLRLARRTTDWYQLGMNIYWIIAALFNPFETGMRWAASKVGLSQPLGMLQKDLLLWFYTAYLRQLGFYLVELNSGRLRLGAARYREIMRRPFEQERSADEQAKGPESAPEEEQVQSVTIALLGQVKAGKSSLVNALLGERQALTDILPVAGGMARYQLQPPGIPTRLVLLDTPGYAHTGPKEDHLRATLNAAQQADLLLLVLHARNPARQADLALLQRLRDWFGERPGLKMPRVLAVLTHIDLLSPAMEWSPPYNWQQPQGLKEQQIEKSALTVREQMGEYLAGVVPVCTAPGKVYGISEGLLPALVKQLDQAHGVAVLRCLQAEFDAGKLRKILAQLLEAAREGGKLLWQSRRR